MQLIVIIFLICGVILFLLISAGLGIFFRLLKWFLGLLGLYGDSESGTANNDARRFSGGDNNRKDEGDSRKFSGSESSAHNPHQSEKGARRMRSLKESAEDVPFEEIK